MRSQRLLAWLCGALSAAVTSIAASPAHAANPPLALDRFDPAPAGDRMFGVPSPFAAGAPGLHLMILGDYAHNPLVLRTTESDKELGSVVSSQLFLHLNATFSMWNRVAVNADAPIAVYQAGEFNATRQPTGTTRTFTSPSSAQFGDVRLGLRLRLFGDYHDIFQLAVGGSVWLPTGAADSYVSDRKVRGLPQLIAGGRNERIVWTFAIGPEFRPSQTYIDVPQSSMLRWGGGIGLLLGSERQFQIGPEFSAALTFDGIDSRTNNGEILLGARYRFLHDFEAGAAMGPGLSSGIGTPDLRAVFMVAYTPEQKKPRLDRDKDGVFDDEDACPDVPGVRTEDPKTNGCPAPKDRDKDGILDADDACPDEPGLPNDDRSKHGCPPPKDRDKDGIIDVEDACPDEPGVASQDPKKHGCPKDTDGDGIIDAKDACPEIKGVPSEDPAQNGCPPDTDGDGIRDDKDACPLEKGKPDPNPKKNGCPTVHVTETEIFILEQVQFDTNKSTIKKVSDELLDKVAVVFKAHPEIKKVEVQGHTDTRGTPAANKILSDNRAKAVVKALVKRGIEASRLTGKGYGQEVPIASNDTEEGRQENRRVQFKIVEKAPKK